MIPDKNYTVSPLCICNREGNVMASLNLVPNPGLLLVQAGIFLANMVVVRKLMVDPYLSLKDRRQALTTGSKEEGEALLRECHQKNEALSQQIAKSRLEASAFRQQQCLEAESEAHALVAGAKKEASEYAEALRTELRENLRQESEKVPAIVAKLVEEVYQACLR